jgi:plasmid stabilization system protein ParE
MSYVLRVLTRARQDVDHIYNWLYARSPGGAARWYAAFLDACDKVVVEPQRFGRTLESDEVGREIRAFYFKTRRGRR